MENRFLSADYQAIFNAIHDAIFIHDISSGAILDVNTRMCELYECTYEETLGANASDFSVNIPPYTVEESTKWIQKAITAGPQTFEWYAQKRSGVPFWVEVTLKPVTLEKKACLMALVHDITERKQLETLVATQVQERTTEMLAWRRRYEQLSELSGMITYEYNPATGALSWGKSISRILGYAWEETDGTAQQWIDWIHPDDRDHALQQLEVAEKTLNNYDVGYRLRHKNGNYIYVRDRGFFLLDEAGEKALEMIGLVTDVTESKLAEESLRESESRFKGLIKQSPFATEIYALDGMMIEVNPAWEELYQTQAENAVGKFNILEDKQAKALGLPQIIQRVFAGEYVKTSEFQFVPGQSGHLGRARWLIGNFYPLRNDKGEVINVVSNEIDITDRKEMELERERLQQEIINAQQRALKELATPIIPVFDQIIVMPLVGSIDSLRAKDLMRVMLEGINHYRAKIVIMDITGVPLLDSGVANHLNKTIRAAQLKGARTIITGISDAVAETIVDLGIDWSEIETLSDLQTGLTTALTSLGFKLGR